MKKRKIWIIFLVVIALLLIGLGLWLLLSSKKASKEVVYDKDYACSLLSKQDDSIIACDLMQTEKEYLVLGVKKIEEQYEAFYQFNLSNGSLVELPMINMPTG